MVAASGVSGALGGCWSRGTDLATFKMCRVCGVITIAECRLRLESDIGRKIRKVS